MTTATYTYSFPIQSSFKANALTTTFTPSSTCTGAYFSNGVYVLGEDTVCKPSGFADASTDYFSPGLACPSGYYTACHDNAGASSITTVTCCPAIGDISLGCVTPSSLSDVWSTLYCTWIAPEDATTLSITRSEDGTTSTVAESVSSPGGLNAQGIRMVYEATDLSTTTTGGTKTTNSGAATATNISSSTSSADSSASGLSTGATAAIAVSISVVGIAAIIGLFFWLRKRKQRYGAVGPSSLTAPNAPSGTMDYKYTGHYDPSNTQELSGVGAQGVRNQQQELVELGPQQQQQQQQQYQQQNHYSHPSELGSEAPVELPAGDHLALAMSGDGRRRMRDALRVQLES